jgi:hypothetical protein
MKIILLIFLFASISCGKNNESYMYGDDSKELRHFQTMEEEKCIAGLEPKLANLRTKTSKFLNFKIGNRFTSMMKDKTGDKLIQDDLIQIINVNKNAIYAKISGEDSFCPENEFGCLIKYDLETSMSLFETMLMGHCQSKMTVKKIDSSSLSLFRKNKYILDNKTYIKDTDYALDSDYPEFMMAMSLKLKKTIKIKNKKDDVTEYTTTVKKISSDDSISEAEILNLKVCKFEINPLNLLGEDSTYSNIFQLNCQLDEVTTLQIQEEALN